jgi:hypothetical protein
MVDQIKVPFSFDRLVVKWQRMDVLVDHLELTGGVNYPLRGCHHICYSAFLILSSARIRPMEKWGLVAVILEIEHVGLEDHILFGTNVSSGILTNNMLLKTHSGLSYDPRPSALFPAFTPGTRDR